MQGIHRGGVSDLRGLAKRSDSAMRGHRVQFQLPVILIRRSRHKRSVTAPFPENAMELVIADMENQVEAADQIVSEANVKELTSLQLAVVGGGLGCATLI
jgi:hypothetical protein